MSNKNICSGDAGSGLPVSCRVQERPPRARNQLVAGGLRLPLRVRGAVDHGKAPEGQENRVAMQPEFLCRLLVRKALCL